MQGFDTTYIILNVLDGNKRSAQKFSIQLKAGKKSNLKYKQIFPKASINKRVLQNCNQNSAKNDYL
jgi:hypothetical protein